MDVSDPTEVVVKKEPSDNASDEGENNSSSSTGQTSRVTNDSIAATACGPLRYVSRRGRPPGGGYSMKSHAHYVSFSSPPNATDLGRQASLGSNSSLSPQESLKTGATSASDGIDIRRFGFQGFDSDKNSFRCDGCDVIFSSRDTYAMHMLLRAKNESCVALPTSAISTNPENPTPREKFERELRQQAMITALRHQAAAMSKAAASILPKATAQHESLSTMAHISNCTRDDLVLNGGNSSDIPFSFNTLFSVDAYGLYVDPRQYRRFLEEYGLRTSASTGSLTSMMEQLSCSVCGELFTNKDALAMHMMFHTREEEKDVKPATLWADVRASQSLSSTSGSSRQSTEKQESPKSEAGGSKKPETSTSADRELTAERVAELKRLAIESSLRSPSTKKQTHRSTTRPKSVSQDTAVTSSAQTRPLSADDAIRLSKFNLKSATESLTQTNSGLGDQYETIFYKRRRLATTEDDSVFEFRQMSSDPLKRKRIRYDGSVYDLFYRSNKRLSTTSAQDAEPDPKVCDNHVSSASGPQDSDETSDVSSGPEQESPTAKGDTDQAAEYSKVRHIPYLDAIMSQDAVFIPLGGTGAEYERNKYSEETLMGKENARIMQASALDFSVSNRDRRENVNNGCGSESTRDETTTLNQSPLKGKKGPEKSPYRGHVFSQYPKTNTNFTSHLENRGHPINSTSPHTSKRDSGSLDQQDNSRMARNSSGDSSSRIGEARYCPHCEILFLDVTLFHLHMGLHNVNNPWQCNTCGLVCSGRLEFNTHVLHY